MDTSRRLVVVFYLLFLAYALPANAQANRATNSASTPIPQASLDQSDIGAGLIKLDVVATDSSGNPVAGLEPKDFRLLDNGQPRRILSFHAFDGIAAKPDPPVEVILVLDTLQIPSDLISNERNLVEAFLRKDGGHLPQPVSVFTLIETGLWQIAESSRDGNVLAEEVAHNRRFALIRSFGARPGGGISMEFSEPPFLEGMKALGSIAIAERRKRGRKLLLWVGPGWGMGSGAFADGTGSKDQTLYTISWFSTLLREARIALYSFAVGETDPRSDFYKGYLQGVESAQNASYMNVYRKVLAVQSGGRVLDRSYDLAQEMESCVREAGVFYTLSFDPPHADHPDEYHALKVQIGKPGLTARTNTGYYDQPYYSDQPEPATRQVTIEQLGQLLDAMHSHGDGEVARQLSTLQLSQRVSNTRLASWIAATHGKKSQQMLHTLADASAFMPPPPSEVATDAPPDAAEQLRMISLAAEYLKVTMPKLPNFFATRTTVRYEERARFDQASSRVGYEPLHETQNFKETVLYRNGSEVADVGTAKRQKRNAKDPYLITYGTFGPILGFVQDAIAVPNALTWSRWEREPNGLRAVFRYVVPQKRSLYSIWGCCLPGGEGTTGFQALAGYHGEITLDPASGAIFRVAAQADLEGFPPINSSNIMITYGPVNIGGKTFIGPLRSVSTMRTRSVTTKVEWDESFRTYGPYLTMLNDISYEDYHMFRGESRMMTGFDTKADEPEAAHPPAN
jgi:VWFA-related protein